MSNPRNLAARMGHWSAQHRKNAIFGRLGLSRVSARPQQGGIDGDFKHAGSGCG